MQKVLKGTLLTLLLLASIGIGIATHEDFLTLFVSTIWSHVAPARVYAENPGILPGGFFYGPIFLVLFQPMTWLEYGQARLVWVGVQALAFILGCGFLKRLFPTLKGSLWAWLAVFLFAVAPVHNSFQSNNIQLLILTALMGSELLSRSRHRFLRAMAGAIVSVLALIKIYPGFIALYYLIVKSRAVRVGVVTSAAVAACVPLLYFGLDQGLAFYEGFVHHLTAYHDENPLLTKPLCLPSVIAKVWHTFGAGDAAIRQAATFASALVSLAFFGWVFTLHRKSPEQADAIDVFSFALALMALVNPSSLFHYFVLYIPGVAAVALTAFKPSLRWAPASLFLATLALVPLTNEGVLGKALNNQLEHWNVPTLGLLMLCVAAFWLIGEARRRRSLTSDRV